MDSERPLTIGYSGTLAFYEGQEFSRGSLKDWFWTYNHTVTDPSTRSASFLFRALAKLRKEHHITAAQIRVLLWGKIDPRYQKLAEELGISDLVQIDGYLPKQQSLERNAQCDLLFLPMESGTEAGKPLFIPGKVFEYMNARKPVLALAGPCDCLDILRPSGLLLAFDPKDEKGVSECLYQLIKDRSGLARFAPDENYINRYSFRNITGKLAGIFDELLAYGH